MKKLFPIIIVLLATCTFASSAFSEAAPQKVVNFANTTLKSFGTDAAIISAVKTVNAKGTSLDEIKQKDEVWKSTAGIDDFMKTILENNCAARLQTLQKEHAFLSEIFVMDNQGANVAMTDKTSDYWQGDEAKFTESIKGTVHISEVEFDDSAQVYQVQVSVPVTEGGSAIGAICFGINLDEFGN